MTPARPELLAPAGDMDRLRTALAYGADAVYLGGPSLSLRAGSAGFQGEEYEAALGLARAHGARVYHCLNALPRDRHMHEVLAVLERLGDSPAEHAPDGLIIADPGVLALARRLAPAIPVHLSTQANTANAEAVAFWRDQGVARVNLARELDMADIRAIARGAPGVELEVFVHGAVCVAYSGRCLMSAWLNRRSANLGECTHPCRFEYRPVRPVELEERTRPGRPTWEVACGGTDGGGFSAVLAAQDLCLVKFLPWFRRLGVAALKLEGRTKSPGYLAQVVDAYATALADLEHGRFRPRRYLAELLAAASRPLGTGMFLPGGRRVVYGPEAASVPGPLVGRILERVGDDAWRVGVRARWDAAQPVAVLEPGLRRPELAGYGLEDQAGTAVGLAHSGAEVVLRADHPALAEGRFLRAQPV